MAFGKSFVFVLRVPPHGSLQGQETLDMILTTAAFDQKVHLLFLDDGVFQLKAGQRPEIIDFKPLIPIYSALSLYDVDELWVEHESLQERGLTHDELILPVHLIARSEVSEFLAVQDVMMSC